VDRRALLAYLLGLARGAGAPACPPLRDAVQWDLGTAGGTSCDPALQSRLQRVLLDQADYTEVINGRFKGGYITRHYGQPDKGIDAVQLELAQSTYMDEATGRWDEAKALKLQGVLRKLLMAGLAYEH